MAAPMNTGPTDEQTGSTVSPFELVKVVWRRKLLVLLVVVLTMLLAVVLAARQPKEYTASASLLFRNPGFASALGGTELFSSSADPKRDAQTNIDVVHSRAVALVARARLKTSESADSLLNTVTVTPSSDSDVATVAAVRATPGDAAAVANAFASGYIDYRKSTDRALIGDAVNSTKARLASATPADQAALTSQLQRLEDQQSLQTGRAEVVAQATPPGAPSAPRPKRNAVFGLIVGLLVGCGLALLVDFLDRRLQNEQDIEATYPDYPVIGLIPEDRLGSQQVTPTGRTGEAYRMVREGLRFVDPDRLLRCILVTSADEGEGKSTVARQLATALSTVGQEVVLVEADMRRPTAGAALGVDTRTEGLSDLLISPVRPHAALARPLGEDSTLAVLTSGTVPPNPADLLRSPRMGQIIEDLLADADVVIIDAPPLDPVADTRTLLQIAEIDAVLLVARVGVTRRDRAQEARRVLRQSGREVLGLVITGTTNRAKSSYYDHPSSGTNSLRTLVDRLAARD